MSENKLAEMVVEAFTQKTARKSVRNGVVFVEGIKKWEAKLLMKSYEILGTPKKEQAEFYKWYLDRDEEA